MPNVAPKQQTTVQSGSDAPPVAITIAGSDSSGGAGIQADLKTFAAFGVFGASAVTAVTAQNTVAVRAIGPVAAEIVGAQIEACFDDLPVAAVKTGMLADATTIDAVVAAMDRALSGTVGARPPLVIDPVMIATSGARLLEHDAIRLLRDRLLPRARLVTPNLPEAAALTGLPEDEPERLGQRLLETGVEAVLVKGGHGAGEICRDWLLTASGTTRTFERARAPGGHHGTGCALSAAICALLARGAGLEAAVSAASDWLGGQIARSFRPLRGELALLPFEPARGRDR